MSPGPAPNGLARWRDRIVPPLRRTLHAAEDELLPPRCLSCSALISPNESAPDRLGPCCRPTRRWPPIPCLGCLGRGATEPDPDSAEGCCPRRGEHRSLGEDADEFVERPLIRLVAHRDPLRAMLLAAKWGGAVDRVTALGAWLASAVVLGLGSPPPIDGVVPIPRSRRRRLRYGRPLAEDLAAEVARRLRRPLHSPLRRAHGPPQTSLDPEERRRAPGRAFTVTSKGRATLRGSRVLLVDDVWTTGATARGAASTLEAAGVEIVIAVLTVAPLPDGRSPLPPAP